VFCVQAAAMMGGRREWAEGGTHHQSNGWGMGDGHHKTSLPGVRQEAERVWG